MTYAASQAKKSGKRPIWLYHVRVGNAEAFYTSRATDYDDEGIDLFDSLDIFDQPDVFCIRWYGSPLRHSRIVQTANLEKSNVNLVMPRTDAMAQAARDDTGMNETLVDIWHLYLDDPDLEKVRKFRGRVVGVKSGLISITLQLESSLTVMRRKGISAVIQRPCRHPLYHGGCKLTLADWQTSGTATAATTTSATVTEAAAQADGYYNGGIIEFGGHMQMITAHVGTSLTLLGPVSGLEAEIAANTTASVTIAPGCDQTMATCETKFNNLDNFGGFPWIDENPFDGRRIG